VIGRKERPTRKGLIGLLWVIFVRVRVCERPKQSFGYDEEEGTGRC
jgi:hypothetical protein